MKQQQTYIVYFKDANGVIRDFNRFGVKQCSANEKKLLATITKYLQNDLVRALMGQDSVESVELWRTDAAGNLLTVRPSWSEKYSDLRSA